MLVDTSVWINHLRRSNDDLVHLLDQGVVYTHPFVIGELACGSLRQRGDVLRLFEALPSALVATDEEARELVTRERLHGSGLGWIDVHLLASARLSHLSLVERGSALAAGRGSARSGGLTAPGRVATVATPASAGPADIGVI